jgi:DNA-binding NtrC family response regulator
MTEGRREAVRLLLVDDERDFLDAVTPGLERRGFEVIRAEDGVRALELLGRKAFDVAVLDVKMPGLDGVSVFRRMRELAPRLPVVLLTGHGSLRQAFETSREGVFDYLMKPCDMDTLAGVAHRAADKRMEAREREHAPADADGRIELLVVDDDVDFSKALTPALARRGMNVTVAHNGEAALALSRARRFHVALVDVLMPGMHGLELMERLKVEDPLLEVVILTGNPTVPDARTALRSGAFDYLVKPRPVEDLADVIARAWQGRRAAEAEGARQTAERVYAEKPR